MIPTGDQTQTPPEPVLSPDDTRPMVGAASTGSANASSAGQTPGGSKATSGFDTLVGRYVVDQGLATQEEVDHCRTIAKSGDDPSGQSLSQLLIANEYVTERQITRLRTRIEAEKSRQEIPGYKVLGKLGAGAMATVYKARQVSLDRMVAIKILPRKYASNPGFIERFFAEGKAAAQLNHPNIVQAYDVGNVEDVYFFVMEYVDGGTVHDVIVKNKRYAERDAIEVAIEVARALEHAHNRGLIHRDVKPKNLMITKQGTVKLADMGLARGITDVEAAEAEKGKAFGTPYYISPEQIRGETNIGPQADIYSLGATLYHMVTGNVPFEGKNPQMVMSKHLKAPLVPPDHVNPKLTPGFSEVIEMMMAKRAKERYRNCRDLLSDLEALKRGEPPPLAHRELLSADALAGLAAPEAQAAATEIPVDRSASASPSSGDLVRHPMFLVLLGLLAVSIVVNVTLLALR